LIYTKAAFTQTKVTLIQTKAPSDRTKATLPEAKTELVDRIAANPIARADDPKRCCQSALVEKPNRIRYA
jgi:hypothetical protein